MNSILFDNIKRHEIRAAYYSEPFFDYLNTSARSEFKRIRDLMDKWFVDFPEPEKKDLRARFRSTDDRHHLGAFFELYCSALLRAQGFDVQVHESADPAKSTQPDFLARLKNTPAFFLESTLAAESDAEYAGQARLDQIYDALDRMISPNFFVGVRIKSAPLRPLSASKIRRFLEGRLGEIDPDKIADLITLRGLEAVPHWTWNDDGWEIVFYPIPKSPAARNKPGIRPIGARSRSLTIDPTSLLSALKSKSNKYGTLKLPFIIAINATTELINDYALTNALFGTERVNILTGAPSRANDGFWLGPHGIQNKGVSGVLFALLLLPWTVASKTPTLWHNPWAEKPLSTELWRGPQMTLNLETSQMEGKAGKNASQVLGLYPRWPEDP